MAMDTDGDAGTGSAGNDTGEAGVMHAISRVLIFQTAVSGLIALVIVISAVIIPLSEVFNQRPGGDTTPEVIKNWGGVIIGFYFGTSISQVASLVDSIRGNGSRKS